MPRVFRAMRKADDGLPRVANNATGLGARVPKDIDEVGGMVAVGEKGMSVNPTVEDVPLNFLPERIDPAGWGDHKNAVFRHGDGLFVQSPFAEGLELLPDGPTHGVVRPVISVTLEQYRENLVATRPNWVDIENENG